jgi:hypothetical protein
MNNKKIKFLSSLDSITPAIFYITYITEQLKHDKYNTDLIRAKDCLLELSKLKESKGGKYETRRK